MTALRNDAERVMKTNFPDSKYLTGKADGKPWWKFWQIWNQ
jgi:outer membrane protein assembly factor BamD